MGNANEFLGIMEKWNDGMLGTVNLKLLTTCY